VKDTWGPFKVEGHTRISIIVKETKYWFLNILKTCSFHDSRISKKKKKKKKNPNPAVINKNQIPTQHWKENK
jgi:hypothetical protein